MMIIEYHRPQTLEETLRLLTRSDIVTIPLGGGTYINSPATASGIFSSENIAVVDLQSLGLDTFAQSRTTTSIGAMVTLQAMLDLPGLPEALFRAIRHETTYNLRQIASVAGTIVTVGGRSPFGTVMLALDAQLTLLPNEEMVRLGDLLPLRTERLHRRLITKIVIPASVHVAYEYVARTPSDQPVVCASVVQWPSGRTRVTLGGYGSTPVLVTDGPKPEGAEVAARAAYSQAEDAWASAAYRSDVAGVLVMRCLNHLAEIHET